MGEHTTVDRMGRSAMDEAAAAADGLAALTEALGTELAERAGTEGGLGR